MLFAKNKTRRPPGCGKSRSVESEENQKQVFLPSHRPWKSRTTRAIPTFPTAPTAAGFSTSLITKVGVGPNETIERGQIKLTNACRKQCALPDRQLAFGRRHPGAQPQPRAHRWRV